MANAQQKAKRINTAGLIWTGLNGVFLLAALGMVAHLLLSKESRREVALESGQRIEFTLVDGQAGNIEGKLIPLEQALGKQSPKERADTQQEMPDEYPVDTPDVEGESEDTPSGILPPPQGEAPLDHQVDTEVRSDGAPVDGTKVVEETQDGALPVIAEDGTMPWQHFAKGLKTPAPDGPQIAIVLYGIGLGEESTKDAIALPPAVTLSFSPYSRQPKTWTQQAQAVGHEILLDLPMQTERYPAVDPGPYGLLDTLSDAENYSRLKRVLTKTEGYIGLLTPLGETLSQDTATIQAVVNMLGKHGLLMVSSATDVPMALSEAAGNAQAPVLHADVILDAKILEGHIESQLAKLETLAQKQGFALGLGRGFPVTVELIAQWSAELSAKGITLVPLTAATRNQL